MPPELVIFDCDGVLVDSELISNRVFCALLNELGLFAGAHVVFDDMEQLASLLRDTAFLPAPRPEDMP